MNDYTRKEAAIIRAACVANRESTRRRIDAIK